MYTVVRANSKNTTEIYTCAFSMKSQKKRVSHTFGWSGSKVSSGEPGTEEIGTVSFMLTSPVAVHFTTITSQTLRYDTTE